MAATTSLGARSSRGVPPIVTAEAVAPPGPRASVVDARPSRPTSPTVARGVAAVPPHPARPPSPRTVRAGCAPSPAAVPALAEVGLIACEPLRVDLDALADWAACAGLTMETDAARRVVSLRTEALRDVVVAAYLRTGRTSVEAMHVAEARQTLLCLHYGGADGGADDEAPAARHVLADAFASTATPGAFAEFAAAVSQHSPSLGALFGRLIAAHRLQAAQWRERTTAGDLAAQILAQRLCGAAIVGAAGGDIRAMTVLHPRRNILLWFQPEAASADDLVGALGVPENFARVHRLQQGDAVRIATAEVGTCVVLVLLAPQPNDGLHVAMAHLHTSAWTYQASDLEAFFADTVGAGSEPMVAVLMGGAPAESSRTLALSLLDLIDDDPRFEPVAVHLTTDVDGYVGRETAYIVDVAHDGGVRILSARQGAPEEHALEELVRAAVVSHPDYAVAEAARIMAEPDRLLRI